MDMSPDRVAQCAQLAMLFELSSSPKPGNVDRCHDFSDIGFHHFLASAVSAYPIFRKAAQNQESIGALILQGVEAWREWKIGSNTHFGSLVLMIPLAAAAGRGGDDLHTDLAEILERTSAQDAVDFYRAFLLSGARIADVPKFSLKDPTSPHQLCQRGMTLRDLMRLSVDHDLIAREWSTDYARSFQLSERLARRVERTGLNDGIVRTFLEALWEVPDSLICAKFGKERARKVSVMAGDALRDRTLDKARQMDCELVSEDINPGSTADLIAASIFISLLKGLRF